MDAEKSQSSFRTRQSLLERVKLQPDDESWDEFVRYYQPFLFILCCRMNLSHHDAEDIVQQALLKMWNKISTFDSAGKSSFRGWMCRITSNTITDFFRKSSSTKNRHDKISTDASFDVPHYTLPEIMKIADEEWKIYITTLAWENIEQQFSEKVIQVFTDLRSGMSRNEIADKYKITVDTVSVYKGRVVSALCAEIKALEEMSH